jgi:hypothetical protein
MAESASAPATATALVPGATPPTPPSPPGSSSNPSSGSAAILRYVGRIPRGVRSAVARATDGSGNRSTVTFALPR